MKTSKNGIDLIKKFEGCKLKAYLCPSGIPTIGYGHTDGVKLGDEINQEQADKFLSTDLSKFENQLRNLIKVELNQNQFDALASLIYNIGYQQFKNSRLLRDINASDFKKASNEFDFIKSNGVVLQGLVKRREEERKLFLS